MLFCTEVVQYCVLSFMILRVPLYKLLIITRLKSESFCIGVVLSNMSIVSGALDLDFENGLVIIHWLLRLS